MVEGAVAGKSQQPRYEGPAEVVARGIPPELQENVLHYLFGRRALPQNAQHQRIDNARVPLVELLESAHIPAKKLLHERRVRRHLVVTLGRENRQEHVYASSAPAELYDKFM